MRATAVVIGGRSAKEVDMSQQLRVTHKWDISYNDRRKSRPWIAAVTTWETGARPVLRFGKYFGDDSGGVLEIAAAPGSPVYAGQKDYWKPRHTVREWYAVQQDGSLGSQITEAEAREAWLALIQPAPVDETPKVDKAEVEQAAIKYRERQDLLAKNVPGLERLRNQEEAFAE